DAAMWFLIADANGLTDQALTEGQTLTIPNKVTNVHNNSATFRPYNAGEAIGDTSPTLPTAPVPYVKKSKGKCGGAGMIIVAVIAVVATVLTAGALAPAAAAVAAGSGGVAAGTFATGLAVLGGTAGLTTGLGLSIGLAAGAIGSAVSQVAGMAMGIQDKFSWGAVATSAITAGIGAGGGFKAIAGSNTIGHAVARNITNQVAGNVTGSQRGFNWSSVAVSAVAAPATQTLTNQMNLAPIGESLGSDLARATTGALVAATTQVAIQGGRLNWNAVAADTLTSLILSRSVSSNTAPGITLTKAESSGIALTNNQQSQLENQWWDDGVNEIDLERKIAKLPLTHSATLNLDNASIIQGKITAGDYNQTTGGFSAATSHFDPNVLREAALRSDLERAVYARDQLNAGYIGPVENLQQVHQLVMENTVSNIQAQLAQGNNWGATWEAAKGATYDMLAPQGTISAAMLVTGGPILRGLGKSLSAAFPTTSVWVANVANKPLSGLYGEAVSGVKSLINRNGVANQAGSALPYNARSIEYLLETQYPGQVTSTTLPSVLDKNVLLAGTRHPVSGIVFDSRGFPVFDSVAIFDTRIASRYSVIENSSAHMRAATRDLREAISRGEVGSSQFTEQQLRAIQGGKPNIPNLTWHHHQDISRMQLIPTKIHQQTGHVGGFEMWFR
ncbi:HNH endonuclease, partial [Methylobacillus arboreus]|uniref:HNH endonuclease n=1 Tax=Methylobacillus arboreus TaxID=755170 RepID=UPI001E60747E